MVGETVEECPGQMLRAERLGPFAKGKIRDDEGRRALVALRHEFEQQPRSVFDSGTNSSSSSNVELNITRPDRDRGHLTVPPLPHHRAYGSVPRRFARIRPGAALAWRRVRGWRASFRVRWYNPIKGIPSLSFRSSVRLPWPRFQAPAHQSGRADFPHPAFGRDHEFAHGRSRVVFPRQIRPWSRHSFTLEKRTYFPDLTLCFRQNHWRSRFVACWSITA